MAILNDKEIRLVQQGFGTVEIEKSKLLETIKINKDKHIEDYNEASKKYGQATLAYALEFVKQLEENIKEVKLSLDAKLALVQSAVGMGEEAYVKEQPIDFKEINASIYIDLSPKVKITVSKPESHEKEYNTVIRNLELSTAEFVVLGQSDFNQYVLDEWIWKQAFINNNYTTISGSTMTGNLYVNNLSSGISISGSYAAQAYSGLSSLTSAVYSTPIYSSSILNSTLNSAKGVK